MTSPVTDEAVVRESAVETRGHSRWRRATRLLSTCLIVLGAIVLLWAVVVWRWNDPITAFYTHREQGKLGHQLESLFEVERGELATDLAQVQDQANAKQRELAFRRHVSTAARRLRASAVDGQAIGRLHVPRLDLNMVMVNGTTSSSLKKGPGRDPRTHMPGQGELVYVAGHRTTYAAPFAHIERMKVGDPIVVDMPYARFRYAVTGHTIVASNDLSVLHSKRREQLALQACHPRFFATQRYIVWAKLVGIEPR